MTRASSNAGTRTRIKICGVTEAEHVHAVADAGADLVGFVLVAASPRALSLDRATILAEAARLRGLERVALVVDPDAALLEAIAATRQFDRVQFHGGESCAAIRSATAAMTSTALPAMPAVKGLRFSPAALAEWNACDAVEWLLLDGPHGGGGEPFDHRELAPLRASIAKPWLLAGGLTVETVGEAIRALHPWGVDVSSGVERTRGVKDPQRIAAFCEAVRAADASRDGFS